MEKYYREPSSKPFLARFFWGLLIFVAVGMSIATLLAYLGASLSPEYFWIPQLFGLAAPILMLADLILMAILLLKLSSWALVPALTLMLGVGFIGNYVQVKLITEYKHDQGKRAKDEFSILTYNVHEFRQYGNANSSTFNVVLQDIVRQNPDIICLQECQLTPLQIEYIMGPRMREWQYQAHSVVNSNNQFQWGLAVLSKLPLIHSQSIQFKGRSNSSMYVDVVTGVDTVRIFNSHLQSTQFNNIARKSMRNADADQALGEVSSTLRRNYELRAFQAQQIDDLVRQSPYATISVGDFNDPPMSYVYHTMRGDMKDSFRESGDAYGYTYTQLGKIFRIDYVLHSTHYEATSYSSPLIEWSDHKPVIVNLKRNK